MKKVLLVLTAFLILASSGLANALCASDVHLDIYISSYTGFSNACQIGDKLFYNFTYTPPVGGQPSSAKTTVIPDPGDGFSNPGIIFSVGGFLVFPGQTLDATIAYSVATLSGSAVMEDYDLTIAGSQTGSGPLGLGTVTESFGNAPAGSPLKTSVGNAQPVVVNAHVSFVPWVNGTTVTTNIHLTQDASAGPSDIVTISAIQEHFSEAVPEPYETVLIGSGLLVFGLFRKRVKSSIR